MKFSDKSVVIHFLYLLMCVVSAKNIDVQDEKNFQIRMKNYQPVDQTQYYTPEPEPDDFSDAEGAESSLKFGYTLPNKSYATFTLTSPMGGSAPPLPPVRESLSRPHEYEETHRSPQSSHRPSEYTYEQPHRVYQAPHRPSEYTYEQPHRVYQAPHRPQQVHDSPHQSNQEYESSYQSNQEHESSHQPHQEYESSHQPHRLPESSGHPHRSSESSRQPHRLSESSHSPQAETESFPPHQRRKRLNIQGNYEKEPAEIEDELLVYPVEDLEALDEEDQEDAPPPRRTINRFRHQFPRIQFQSAGSSSDPGNNGLGQPSPSKSEVRPHQNWLPVTAHQFSTTTSSPLEAYEDHQNSFEEEDESNDARGQHGNTFHRQPLRVFNHHPQYQAPTSKPVFGGSNEHQSPFSNYNHHYSDQDDEDNSNDEISGGGVPNNGQKSRFPRRMNLNSPQSGFDNTPFTTQRPSFEQHEDDESPRGFSRPITRFQSEPQEVEEEEEEPYSSNRGRQPFTVRPQQFVSSHQEEFNEEIPSEPHNDHKFRNFPQRQRLDSPDHDPKPKRFIQNNAFPNGNQVERPQNHRNTFDRSRVIQRPTVIPEPIDTIEPQAALTPLDPSRPASSPFQFFPQKQLHPPSPPTTLRAALAPFRQQRSHPNAIEINQGQKRGQKVRKVLRRKIPSDNPLEPEHVTVVPAPPEITEEYRQRQRQPVIRGPTPLPRDFRQAQPYFHSNGYSEDDERYPSMTTHQRGQSKLEVSSSAHLTESSSSMESQPDKEKIFSRSESRTRNEFARTRGQLISRPRTPRVNPKPGRSRPVQALQQDVVSSNHHSQGSSSLTQEFYAPNNLILEAMKPIRAHSARQLVQPTDYKSNRISMTQDVFDNPSSLEFGGFMPIHNPYGSGNLQQRTGRQSADFSSSNQLQKRHGQLLATAPNETTFINHVANYVVDKHDMDPSRLEDLVNRVVSAEFERLKPIDTLEAPTLAGSTTTTMSSTTQREDLASLFRSKLLNSLQAASVLKGTGSCAKQMQLLKETFPQCKSFVDVDNCLKPHDTYALSKYGKCLMEYYPVIRTLPFTRSLSATGAQGQVSFESDKECTEFVHIFFADCKHYVDSCAAVQDNSNSELPVLGCLFSQYTALMMPLLNTGIKVHYR